MAFSIAVRAYGKNLTADSVNRLWKTNRFKAKFNNLVTRDGYVYGLDDGRAHLEGTTKTGGWKPPELAGRRPALRSAAVPAASSWGFRAPSSVAPPAH